MYQKDILNLFSYKRLAYYAFKLIRKGIIKSEKYNLKQSS